MGEEFCDNRVKFGSQDRQGENRSTNEQYWSGEQTLLDRDCPGILCCAFGESINPIFTAWREADFPSISGSDSPHFRVLAQIIDDESAVKMCSDQKAYLLPYARLCNDQKASLLVGASLCNDQNDVILPPANFCSDQNTSFLAGASLCNDQNKVILPPTNSCSDQDNVILPPTNSCSDQDNVISVSSDLCTPICQFWQAIGILPRNQLMRIFWPIIWRAPLQPHRAAGS